MPPFKGLPGFRDFYPEAFSRREHLFRLWRSSARACGFQEYDGPVLEPLDLYRAKSGEEVEGQLFGFIDKGGREVSLRPELTPTLARMIGARAGSLPKPIKWFSIGENYRYERQQKGRLRAFFQMNADIFGEPGPEAEVELIALLIQCLTATGLTAEDFKIRLSDRDIWLLFLESHGVTGDAARDLLGAIDKLERAGDKAYLPYEERHGSVPAAMRTAIEEFTRLRDLDSVGAALKTATGNAALGARIDRRLEDWRVLLDGLTAMGLSPFVQVDPGVVRGLAYYTGFVFEAFDRAGAFRALAGGGRYDNLVRKLGGPDLPAAGFGIGDVVLGEMLAAKGLQPVYVQAPDAFVVMGPGEARKAGLGIVRLLRNAGIATDYSLRPIAFGKQFRQAGTAGARIAVICGEDELARKVAKLRDMRSGTESDAPLEHMVTAIRELLET